jgi:hypothetical protein
LTTAAAVVVDRCTVCSHTAVPLYFSLCVVSIIITIIIIIIIIIIISEHVPKGVIRTSIPNSLEFNLII